MVINNLFLEQLESSYLQTTEVRKAFKGSIWQKFRQYPLNLFLDRLWQKFFGGNYTTQLIENKLFWGRRFYTNGYFLDYYLCGFIAEPIELALTRFLIRTVTPETVFFDVGAHYGFFSVLVADLISEQNKQSRHVYSFEPTPATVQILSVNTHDIPIIKVVDSAVAEDSKTRSFAVFSDIHHGGSNSLYEQESKGVVGQSTTKTIEVKTVSLDKFCQENEVFPNLIKIDVEGAEQEVLQGAKVILKHRPTIVLEIWPVGFNHSHMKAVELLLACGYFIYSLGEDGGLHKTTPEEVRKTSIPINIVLQSGTSF